MIDLLPYADHFPALSELEEEGFGWWLAGFIDAEGTLISERGKTGSIIPSLKITMRDDDGPVLDLIVQRTKCGYASPVTAESSRRSGHPKAEWRVKNRVNTLFMAHVLQRFSGHSKKTEKELELWIRIVDFCSRRTPSQNGDWEPARAWAKELREAKKYDPAVYEAERLAAGIVFTPHLPYPPQRLWCERGQHWWEREHTSGSKPSSCRDHPMPRVIPTQHLWCEVGGHNWEREARRGTPPANCPEHPESSWKTWTRRRKERMSLDDPRLPAHPASPR